MFETSAFYPILAESTLIFLDKLHIYVVYILCECYKNIRFIDRCEVSQIEAHSATVKSKLFLSDCVVGFLTCTSIITGTGVIHVEL